MKCLGYCYAEALYKVLAPRSKTLDFKLYVDLLPKGRLLKNPKAMYITDGSPLKTMKEKCCIHVFSYCYGVEWC